MADPEDEDEVEIEKENEEEEKVKIRWIKLHTIIYECGAIFLSEDLTKKKANTIIGLMISLALQDQTRAMYLYINCVAGSARMGVAVSDAIQVVPPDVYTLVSGMAAGVGSFILLSGNMRLAYPHARVMIQKPTYSMLTHYENGVERAHWDTLKEFQILDNLIYEIVVRHTGQPYDIIKKDMKKKLFMSAKEAQDYGIVDLITSEFTFDIFDRDDNPDGDSSEGLYDL